MNVTLESTLSSISNIKAIIIGFDDVIYPKKDYDLQVFYMFGQFIEFLEGKPIGMAITEDLKSLYLQTGNLPSFALIADKYELKTDYSDKLERLYHQVQLPLKLELYPEILDLLKQLDTKGVQIMVLTKNDPFMQLNKMKQTEWHGLDQRIKLYFTDELAFKNIDPIPFILEENSLQAKDVAWLELPNVTDNIKEESLIKCIDPQTLLNTRN